MSNGVHDTNGRFAIQTFEGVYDAIGREIRRIDQLRSTDQLAIAAALAAVEKATATALTASDENQRRTDAQIEELRHAAGLETGRKTGVSATWSTIIAVITVVAVVSGTVVGIVVSLLN